MNVEIFNIAEISADSAEQKYQFSKMKRDEQAVYELLCPEKNTYSPERIAEMKDIPSRIQELVEATKGRFYSYEIWEAESAVEKDPIILGREQTKDEKGEVRSKWYDEIYFLGRWGAELESFNVLKDKAEKCLIDPVKIELMKIKAKVDFYLADVPMFTRDAIRRGSTSLPSMSEGCLPRF